MTLFLRILEDREKERALGEVIQSFRAGRRSTKIFQASPALMAELPGAPFAYWIAPAVRSAFRKFSLFEEARSAGAGKKPDPVSQIRPEARIGLQTSDDFRFVRGWWEPRDGDAEWLPFAKGGPYSPFYGDIHLALNWASDGSEIKNFVDTSSGQLLSRPQNTDYFRRPGLTWSLRTKSRLSLRVLPAGCAFSNKGPSAFCEDNDPELLLALLGACSATQFYTLVEVQLAAADAQLGGAAHSFEVGVIQRTPLPPIPPDDVRELSRLTRRAWRLSRRPFTSMETSREFLLPAFLLTKLGILNVEQDEEEAASIRQQIEHIGDRLYGFSSCEGEPISVPELLDGELSEGGEDNDDEDSESCVETCSVDGVWSWAVGVAFSRFDWRLATGERQAPREPEPFDRLPSKSPGMLPDGAAPFHTHAGILVDDPGHPHDLARLVEEVLARVDVAVPDDVRRWLQRDFFAFHLQRYSKSRRKAPICWPLATTSASYTLWVYYPRLSSQTLYTAINDFVEPKLKQVGADVTALRNKGSARIRDDEKQFEALQAFELELIELRDTLLKLAPSYKPNHDDGVQISAAPLWPLFRHKPWQKVLKDTWAKLEKGDYDWAHLAMNYWPERVREKCKTDKSTAIAHGLEDLYIELEAAPKKTRGRKKTGGDE